LPAYCSFARWFAQITGETCDALTRIGIAVQSISSGMLLFRHMRCGEGGTGQRTNIFLLWKCAPLPIEDI
jgi:hypothetical protein